MQSENSQMQQISLWKERRWRRTRSSCRC